MLSRPILTATDAEGSDSIENHRRTRLRVGCADLGDQIIVSQPFIVRRRLDPAHVALEVFGDLRLVHEHHPGE